MPTYLGQPTYIYLYMSTTYINLPTSTYPWSSLVEGGEGSYLPNCQTTLVIALDAMILLFCIFINTTAYH